MMYGVPPTRLFEYPLLGDDHPVGRPRRVRTVHQLDSAAAAVTGLGHPRADVAATAGLDPQGRGDLEMPLKMIVAPAGVALIWVSRAARLSDAGTGGLRSYMPALGSSIVPAAGGAYTGIRRPR